MAERHQGGVLTLIMVMEPEGKAHEIINKPIID